MGKWVKYGKQYSLRPFFLLSIAPCVQHVLDYYEELKLHFQLVKDEEHNYTAELLYQM